jgi:dCMP deaminase
MMLGKNFVYAQLINCYKLAINSRDLSSQNGAMLFDREGNLLGEGYNDFPKGVEWTEDRATTRPIKYEYTEHAERNAIFDAALFLAGNDECGYPGFRDCQMVCPWAACADCARAIIQIGVKDLYVHKKRMDLTSQGAHATEWNDKVNRALGMMREAGVNIHYADIWLEGAPLIRADTKLWSPAGVQTTSEVTT